jgi:pimeloyl-ACP methyl ester carboxylesterase
VILFKEYCDKSKVIPTYTLITDNTVYTEGNSTHSSKNHNNSGSRFHYANDDTTKKTHAERLRQRIDEAASTAASNHQKQQVSVEVVDEKQRQHLFYSRIAKESSNDARKRTQTLKKDFTPTFPLVLKRQAARNALFSMQGFNNAPRDWEFINLMHLARHIYKPDGQTLTLAQYASLTRNFMNVVLNRLDDPHVHQLWTKLKEYRRALDELGVTDKYVSSFIEFDIDGDGKIDMKEQLQSELQNILQQNRVELMKQSVLVPLGLIGTVVHAPVVIFAHWLGVKMGVSDARDGGAPSKDQSVDGKDQSVVATMRMVGGFVGIAILYPGIALGIGVFTSMSPLAVVACVAISGYAMILRQPVETFVRKIKNAQKMHSFQNTEDMVQVLKKQRDDLQMNLRQFADDHAPDDNMVGWWRNPSRYVKGLKVQQLEAEQRWLAANQRVTPDLIAEATLSQFTIPLKRNLRHPLERAVLTSKTEEGNTKALVWLPGRNDSFYHVHILDRLLATGFDVHALDLRRCGRAKYDTSGTEITGELFAHDSYDFGEYNEEIDAVLKFLKNPGRLPATSNSIEDGGCGKVYDKIVCYSHSTGGLVSASYSARRSRNPGAWRGAFDGFIFNSPFFDFNLPWYQNIVVKHGSDLIDPDRIISQGGNDSEYSRKLYHTYGFNVPEHKSLKELHVTAGWVAAVTNVQDQLVAGKLRLPPYKPSLVLSTSADEVLLQEDISSRAAFLCADSKEERRPVEKPIWETGVVERRIGTSATSASAHDVFAAPSSTRVDEAMCHVERWLATHFPS